MVGTKPTGFTASRRAWNISLVVLITRMLAVSSAPYGNTCSSQVRFNFESLGCQFAYRRNASQSSCLPDRPKHRLGSSFHGGRTQGS